MIGKLFLLLLFGVIYASADENICKGLGTGDKAEFLPNPDNCTQYTTCWREIAYPNNCPNGLFFDPVSKLCVSDSSVCNINYCKVGEIEAFPKEGKCVEYILCVDGKTYEMECGEGLYFSTNASDCVLKKESGCIVNLCSEVENIPGKLPAFADEFDCTKYYICVKGKPNPKACATGAYFDEEAKKCVAGKCPPKPSLEFVPEYFLQRISMDKF